MASNQNKDSLLNIKSWLKKQDNEEELSIKSRDRVHNDMAKQIRQIKPLPIGPCNLCGIYTERLVPINIKICGKCIGKIKRHGGEIDAKREVGRYTCDLCFNEEVISFKINPFVCVKCTTKQGKRHKRNVSDFKNKNIIRKNKKNNIETESENIIRRPISGRRVA